MNVGLGSVVLDSAAADPVGTEARLHEYVYGGCPPVGAEPRVTKVPVVPVVGALIDIDRGGSAVTVIVTTWEFSLSPNESVTARLT